MTQRKEDYNGWWEIKRNPITKVGVFPYLGANIPGAPDPLKVYYVLRPAAELAAPECLESLKLLPWVNDHDMLGPVEEGYTPAEEKGVQGVTGEDVTFEDGVVYATLKAFSETLKNDIESGKIELSLGYFNGFRQESGTWNGQEYQYVQHTIRGNHLALVEKGRSGPDVAVMDENNITNGASTMGEVTLEKIAAAVQAVVERLEKLEAKGQPTADEEGGTEGESKDNEGGTEGESKDNEGGTEGESKDNEGGTEGESKDNEGGTEGESKDNEGGTDGESKDNEEKGVSMDAAIAGTLRAIAGRDALVQKLAPLVGTFDHACMTAAQVATYGCKKLGIPCKKGQEGAALAGYLQAAGKHAARPTFSLDHAHAAPGKSPALSAYLAGK